MKKNLIIILISACILVFLSKPAAAQVSIGVSISANIAPPPLPVYEQPPCPVDGYLWCPGYWAYTEDGYFWVPGIWVVPPRYGYLWTPPYWGFESGVYGFHSGYWGPHVGFYGGVNYGYGYWGSGFGGGRWRGSHFSYNTAVVNVNRTVIHNTYVDKTVIVNNSGNRRISYNGGPGGIAARPSSREQTAIRESHVQSTVDQTTHIQQARANKAQFAHVNHGQPATVAMNQSGSHIEHEPARTKTMLPTSSPSTNHNRPASPSDHNANHMNAANHQDQKTNHPPAMPQHYVPLTKAQPVQTEHPAPQHQREYSRQEHPNNPQAQHMNPQQQHMNPQQHPAQQARPAPEPHNQPQHNPEKR